MYGLVTNFISKRILNPLASGLGAGTRLLVLLLLLGVATATTYAAVAPLGLICSGQANTICGIVAHPMQLIAGYGHEYAEQLYCRFASLKAGPSAGEADADAARPSEESHFPNGKPSPKISSLPASKAAVAGKCVAPRTPHVSITQSALQALFSFTLALNILKFPTRITRGTLSRFRRLADRIDMREPGRGLYPPGGGTYLPLIAPRAWRWNLMYRILSRWSIWACYAVFILTAFAAGNALAIPYWLDSSFLRIDDGILISFLVAPFVAVALVYSTIPLLLAGEIAIAPAYFGTEASMRTQDFQARIALRISLIRHRLRRGWVQFFAWFARIAQEIGKLVFRR
jgi:hypothetical protein